MTTQHAHVEAPAPALRTRASRWVAWAALLCGIHCLLTPVLVLALPFLALGEGVEWGALVATVALGALLLALGPAHQRMRNLGLLLAGGGLWYASLLGLLEPLPEALTSSLGSVVVAGALLLSTRPCADGSCDHATDGEAWC